ncbi:tyrosine-type recombinase/integrase [Streptomyces sp. NPDC087844]|uniref:tyrosine-type recombinase/integrase n=1 Tax=Streptomyces sp. NPDC087844 TaxID=3365805 RepID=UPI00380FCFB0
MRPADGATTWIVISRDYEIHSEATSYLTALASQQDASVHTLRSYAGRVALYLSYCAGFGICWSAPTIVQLAQFLRWLVEEPLPARSQRVLAEPRHRSKKTANAIMTTSCQFLRHCSLHGWVAADLTALLTEPRLLHHMPTGYNTGEDDQYRTVRARKLKFKVAVSGYEYLTDEQVLRIIDLTRHARDRFLVSLLAETGVRIGETLGLRREDMHLLSNSTTLGCPTVGPHIHVRRRQNSNGALAKSRQPRSIPVSDDLVGLYADYQWEREAVPEAASCDMTFVNLFRTPLGSPMKYQATYDLFARLAKRAGFTTRPHMFRHSAATRWIRQGKQRHVVQNLLGHVSEQSMEICLNPRELHQTGENPQVAWSRRGVEGLRGPFKVAA